MKQKTKSILITISTILFLFLIDFICIFTINRPLFAIKDKNDKVYYGIIYNIYYCNDYTAPVIKLKQTKYFCSSEIKLNNYDFSVVVDNNSKHKKIFNFKNNEINYYYGNTDFTLYLTEDNYKYNIEKVLTNNMLDISDILEKSIEVKKDLNNKIYYYNNFKIIVCNNDIIIGDTDIELKDYCDTYE